MSNPLPDLKQISVENYNYNVDVDDEEDYAGALKLSATERMHHILMDQVEDIEVRLFDVKESILVHKRKISMAEALAKDFTDLLKVRSEESSQLQKDLAQAHTDMENLLGKRGEIEADRRKYEQRIAILATELENNRRVVARLEKVQTEIEYMKKKAHTLVIENADLRQNSERQTTKIAELEKQLAEEALSSRVTHNKTIVSIEKQIEDERQRGQAAIDEARKLLKAKILVLEASIEDIQKSGLDANRDIRRQEKNLKTLVRRQEEQRALISHDSRRIESLERQLVRAQEQTDKLVAEKTELESRNYAKQREIGALSAQVEAALYVNTKLNSEVTPEKRFLINTSMFDDDADVKTEAKSVSKPVAATSGKKYDTSVDAL
jgi:chromosome segregation ATPase